MKKSRFSEEQIIGVLKEADAGMKVADLYDTQRRRACEGRADPSGSYVG
ncbi:hypothetical protein B0G84_8091 [Paraburkholderia sp. BL8N3]|nr:hypothetical protein [Paraburkholderia sp. BL8N3]TCK33771.1 hypothetical protein B0G84_8091 [Paraburkholderia sp. BL8N3]